MRTESLSALERHLIAAAASRTTVATYARIASRFLDHVAPRVLADVDTRDVETFLVRSRVAGTAAATSTRNLEVVALRALFRSVALPDPTASMRLKRGERREPAVPSTSELRSLFEAAERSADAARDLALLVLLFQCGLRVAELVRLAIAQVDLVERVLVGVDGKNGTRCDLPLGPEAALLTAAWLVQHPTGEGALFPRSRGAGHVSARSVQRIVARLRVDAGIAKRITPHSLRHATATQAIARGVDLPTAAALMRHARVETTMGYVALASEARRDAVNRIGQAVPRGVLPLPGPDAGVLLPVDAEDELRDAG